MPKLKLRGWQIEALNSWEKSNHRGIISVVTGGGKTVFALSCIDRLKPTASLIVVPTEALLEQWWEEAASYFDLSLDEVNIISGTLKFKLGAINIAVINTAMKLPDKIKQKECFLIVDECHKAASEHFKNIFNIKSIASLGLSATPERPYDEGLNDILIPALGPVIYQYDYKDALRDGVIVPFDLKNVIFDLESDCQKEYDKLTKAIAQSINKSGSDSEKTVSLYIKRARVLNLSLTRIRLAVKIAAANNNKRTLIFHEDIQACEIINSILANVGINSGVYHSKLKLKTKAEMLNKYRKGEISVLVTCRALDEGFNVPETELGIIAASTATRRQRIQRLGRILRPSQGKERATIYSLVASTPEIARLKDEEEALEGVADVSWSHA